MSSDEIRRGFQLCLILVKRIVFENDDVEKIREEIKKLDASVEEAIAAELERQLNMFSL